MRTSIIVTHYKTPRVLEKCLKALLAAIHPLKAEIILSDSATSPVLAAALRQKFPGIIFLPHSQNVGYGRLVNDGLSRARGEFLFILNADIIVSPAALRTWLLFMAQHPDIGVSGPKLVNLDGSWQSSCFRFYTPLTILARRTIFGKTAPGRRLLARFLMYDYERRVPREVDWLMGSALCLSRAAYQKVGGFDPRFFMYFEDVDWCRRCWLAGYRVVFNPHVELTHYHMKASDTRGGLWDVFTNQLTRVHVMSALKYFIKYLGQPLPYHLN